MLSNYLDRWGAGALLDEPLSLDEVVAITATNNVVNNYRQRQSSKNWAEWANKNPTQNELLIYAQKCAVELGMIDAN